MRRTSSTILSAAALAILVGSWGTAEAQSGAPSPRGPMGRPGVAPGTAPDPAPAATPYRGRTPSDPPYTGPTGGPAAPSNPATGVAGGAAAGASPAAGAAPGAAGGKASGDTDKLPQFEQSMEFEPRNPNYKVAFSLEDADLDQLVRVIGQLTGKRFIFGGKLKSIKASVYSPQKVTVAEAYQAFLSILETNGLTVIPHGRFLKIVDTQGIANQTTPTFGSSQAAPGEDRYVTRMHRLQRVNAEEVAQVLGKFKSKDGDISTYAPGNLLIITDTGVNIRRMMGIVEEIDVGGAGDQIWIEPVHYASATDVANRVNELFDLKGGAAPAPERGKGGAGGGGGSGGGGGGELHITKILPDDRTNSVIVVATEKAYLRILELIKKIDVPQSAEGEIHVLSLQHADAIELTKTLTEIVSGAAAAAAAPAGGGRPGGGQPPGGNPAGGIFEGGVKVSADKATNSIVVTSSLRDYVSLRTVVDRLDLPRRQVFIEAVIMDLSIRRSDQLGVNFHGGDDFSTDQGKGLVYGGLNPLKTILLPGPNDLQGMALGVRAPGIPGTENLLGTGLSIPAFGVLVNALASSGDADVLSTPHILATDNIAAEINVGENIPLQTNVGAFPGLGALGGAAGANPAAGALGGLGALGGGFGGTARQDVGTKVKILPHLNESNEVRLELTEEISEARDPQGQLGVVPITKRTAQTQLIVADQQTVVIGGLMRNRVVHSEDKIPVLGDIPVLGALFRSTHDDLQKSNLILILTPYVIREQADLRTIFERKMQERQEFLDRFFVFSEEHEYQPPKDYARTNGLVEVIHQSFRAVEEKKRMEELLRPKELLGHEPSEPLEMPAAPRTGAAGGAGANTAPTSVPTASPPPGERPPVNVSPQPRNLREVER